MWTVHAIKGCWSNCQIGGGNSDAIRMQHLLVSSELIQNVSVNWESLYLQSFEEICIGKPRFVLVTIWVGQNSGTV